MNRGIWIVLFALLLTGCKAWDPSDISQQKNPIAPKLLALEPKVDDLANKIIATNNFETTLFNKEVEDNLTDPYGEKYGYITLKRNILSIRPGWGFYALSILTATIANLFGMPFMVLRLKSEVEIRIMDKNNRLIGKYSAIGESKSIAAYYYGYAIPIAYIKCCVEAENDAFSKIRPLIQADVSRVNDKLKEAGKL